MILKQGVKVQLVVFVIFTILISVGCIYYIGLDKRFPGSQYTAYVDLTDSGGVFTNAEVTYRGVPVGRVGPIELTEKGIRVKLNLVKGRHIPRDTEAVVANRSAVGEQYIDLRPVSDKGPYLDEGKPFTIPAARTHLPVSTAELLRNTDRLVSSVNPQHLGVIVDELDKAFNGSAADLQSILDSSDRILRTAEDTWPATSQLLDNSRTVLDTQRAQGGNIQNFAARLKELTGQLRDDDPYIRQDLDATTPAVGQVDKAIDGLAPTLPVLLANLTLTGQVITSRIDGLRSLFILYPLAVSGAFTVTPGDGTQHLGLVLNSDVPPPCTKGYEKVPKRWPQFTKDTPTRLDTGCKEPHNSPTAVRGARNFPKESIRPFPKVPPGATDGAGFPVGGAYGTSKKDGTDKAASAKRTEAAAQPDKNEQVAAQPQQQAEAQSPSTIYIPISPKSVQVAGYDPATGTVYGPDGKRYVMPRTAGNRQLGEEASWKWLLLGPLAQ